MRQINSRVRISSWIFELGFRVGFCEMLQLQRIALALLISSLNEQLSKAEQLLRNQTDRSDYLETQCTFLNGKIKKLVEEIAETEKEGDKATQTTSAGVQTNDNLEMNSKKSQNEVFVVAPSKEVVGGNEKQLKHKNSFVDQIKGPRPPETEKMRDLDHNKQGLSLIQQNEPSYPHGTKNEIAKVDEIVASKSVKLGSTASNESLPSTNAVVLTGATMDALPKVHYSKRIHSLDLNHREHCTNKEKNDAEGVLGKTLRVITGAKCVLPLPELSKEPPCEDVADDVAETEALESSPLVEKKDGAYEQATDDSVKRPNVASNNENPVMKRVRFSLERQSHGFPHSEGNLRNEEIPREDPQIMFSDEEGTGKDSTNIDDDVSRRISRIQNLLRNDRLRTNRKRKYPVV
ncbi:uncharacterized protein [Montipora foliosa]|uniref:uncharacterized protein isoform X2 n=1 Tax=Montipora foliosa TaxID=591990 RepID=UPI0035F20D45